MYLSDIVLSISCHSLNTHTHTLTLHTRLCLAVVLSSAIQQRIEPACILFNKALKHKSKDKAEAKHIVISNGLFNERLTWTVLTDTL